MKSNPLTTPVHVKTDEQMPWPDDKFFYLVAREGLFKCRNHEFFQSCSKVDKGPVELSSQEEFLHLSYPKIPRRLLEVAVGFFQLVADKQNSEAALITVFNRQTGKVELIVPDQTGINSAPSKWNPRGCPMDVKYEIPPLPPHLALIGDIHCHVDGSAYASYTDEKDEVHRPGIHIVVGHIDQEPPQFYCDAVADGKRFEVKDLKLVTEGYGKRRLKEVPPDWVGKVKLQEKKYGALTGSTSYYQSDYYGGVGGYKEQFDTFEPNADDASIIRKHLEKLKESREIPTTSEIQQRLYAITNSTTFSWCGKKAHEFVKEWNERKDKHEIPTQ